MIHLYLKNGNIPPCPQNISPPEEPPLWGFGKPPPYWKHNCQPHAKPQSELIEAMAGDIDDQDARDNWRLQIEEAGAPLYLSRS